MGERTLQAPLDETFDDLNIHLQSKCRGAEGIYFSIDTIIDPEDAVNHPIEYLNSLTPPGFPPNRLIPKDGVPIMLIRNFRSPKICNGALLCVRELYANMIDTVIIKRPFEGRRNRT